MRNMEKVLQRAGRNNIGAPPEIKRSAEKERKMIHAKTTDKKSRNPNPLKCRQDSSIVWEESQSPHRSNKVVNNTSTI